MMKEVKQEVRQVEVIDPQPLEEMTAPVKSERKEIQQWSWKNLDGTTVRLGVKAVKTFFCPRATDLEALSFIAFCRSKRLDPFANEVFLVKYSDRDPARFVVARDTLIRRAQLAGEYLGFKSGVIVERKDKELEARFLELERQILYNEAIPEDERMKLASKVRQLGEYIVNTYKEVVELEGAFVPSGYTLVGGWCSVYYKDKPPITAKVMLAEYNKDQASWRSMPATMIVKVAEAHAHRKAAPSFNAALYTAEELGTAPVSEERLRAEIAVENPEEQGGETRLRQEQE